MKLACLIIDHLPVQVELHRHPRLHGRSIILSHSSGSQRTVLDASAAIKGVVPGMPLARALSFSRDAVLLEADLPRYRQVFDQVLDSLEQGSFDVDEAGLGQAYVRLDNVEAMHWGEASAVKAVLGAVPAYLTPKVGVGAGKFPASVAAAMAEPGSALRVPEKVRDFLAPLSINLLPVEWKMKERLLSFGLEVLGQVAALGSGPLQAQFGPTGKMLWDLTQGRDIRPFFPRRLEETIEESLSFQVPIASLEAIVTAADNLLARAFNQPGMRGRFARICTFEGSVFRAPTWRKEMVFREPIGDKNRAITLVKHTLEGHPPSGPLEDLQLILSGLTGEAGRQENLFLDVRRRENLKEALRQLKARLGIEPPIYAIREVEPWSRLPERRQALVPYVP